MSCYLSIGLALVALSYPGIKAAQAEEARAEEGQQTPSEETKTKDKPTPPPPPSKIQRLTIRGQVFEASPPMGIFGNAAGDSLGALARAIRSAAADATVGGLVIRLRTPALGWTQAQTLRRELVKFRDSGKPSYCYVTSATTLQYLLASACSEVVLHPAGLIEIPGVSAQRMYMKGLFEKVGVQFQELRVGRYKSAAETYTRDGPSAPVREELQSILDHMYDDLVSSLAENRGMKALEIRALIDRRLFDAEEARKAGLVDRVEYTDQFAERIRKNGGLELAMEDVRLGKERDLDFSGFAGMMRLFNEILGAGKGKARGPAGPKLAVIVAEGPIVDDALGESLFLASQAITPAEMVRAFSEVRDDDSVKAVVFRINSPGGSALASDLILRQVKLTAKKKPVIVSMADVAGSGGYYIACGASHIFAEKGTLTGSIGVIGVIPNMKGLYEKLGVKVETVSRGKRAEIISSYGALGEDGRELFMKYMLSVYDDFLSHVAQGRKLSKEAVATIAEGRVWTGEQALKHGLVDAIGGIEEAVQHAREAGGLKNDAATLLLPRQKTLFDLLQGNVRVPRLSEIAIDEALRILPREARRWLEQMSWIRNLGGRRVLTLMTDIILVR